MTWSRGTAVPGNRWDLLDGEEPAEPPRVSVIVAHYRQPDQLARTLHALARQDHPRDRLQIIVADDGSPDVPDVPDDVLLVRQDDHGFRLAAVRNLGAAAATGEVLVFLDADTTPEPAFIRRLVRLPAVAPDCIAVGRRRHARLDLLAPTAEVERLAAEHELPEPRWLTDGYRRSRDLLDADDRSYRFVIGAVLACSRLMYDEVGPFDETFAAYGGEDWEWAYRAWVRGALLAHVPDAVAWHDGPEIAERGASDTAAKNDEAILLSDLIPVPGSGGRAGRGLKADILVTGPPEPATRGQRFVSIDSVLAALPGAESRSEGAPASAEDRLDRIRIRVELLRPVLVSGGALADAVDRVGAEGLADLRLADADGVEVIRIVSTRAEARQRRWARDDLFPVARARVAGVRAVTDEVDVEAYLGGWS